MLNMDYLSPLMKQLYCILFFLVTTTMIAQEWQWAKHFGDDGSDVGSDIGVDKYGNSYVCGYRALQGNCTNCYNQGQLHKFDQDGNKLWTKTNLYVGEKSLVTDTEGNSYMVWGGRIIKFDSDGNELWFLKDTSISFTSIALLPNGSIVGCGVTFNQKGIVARITASGGKLWQKTGDDYGMGGNVSADKNGIIFYSGGYNSDTTIVNKGLLMRFDSTGNMLSYCSIPEGGLTLGSESSFYIMKAGGLFEAENGIEPDDFRTHIIKYDLNGQILWHNIFSGPNTGPRLEDMTLNEENNLILSGYFRYYVKMNNTEILKGGYGDLYLLKLSYNGDLVWTKKATSVKDLNVYATRLVSKGNNIYMTGEIICAFSNSSIDFGEVVINGSTFGSYVWQDLFLGKVKDNNAVSLNEQFFNQQKNNLTVFPNPGNGEFNIDFTNSVYANSIQIKVINILGEVIYLEEIKSTAARINKVINLGSQCKGTYFIIVNSNEISEVKKIVIQ